MATHKSIVKLTATILLASLASATGCGGRTEGQLSIPPGSHAGEGGAASNSEETPDPQPSGGGSASVDPTVEDPPVEDPPVDDPPVEEPPVEEPPVEDPPVKDPPPVDPAFGQACVDFNSVWGKRTDDACNACIQDARGAECGAAWSTVLYDCRSSSDCADRNCLCERTAPRYGDCSTGPAPADVCGCIDSCLVPGRNWCRDRWTEYVGCLGSACSASCE